MASPSISTEMGIDASPTKTFFMDMLTRDIGLEDAILDLLDNCVDGMQRTNKNKKPSDKPYENFWAKISFSETDFTIEDNCGGIPLETAKTYAFRMGRPIDVDENNPNVNTIGTYGIGMKRAIFKMGRSGKVISQTETESFCVTVPLEWDKSSEWKLPFEQADRSMESNGTIIRITDIQDSIKARFRSSTLSNSLFDKISHYYSYIMEKGFVVYVNDNRVSWKPFELLWEGIDKINENTSSIAPYLYKSECNGVSIELAIGFYRPTATESEVKDENEGKRMTSENAGWTIICNDRVVVYHDKTRLTGWGEDTVPSYHPQFISITGTVHFRCSDPKKLPITTTKRGLEVSSDLYLYTRDFMKKGLKIFTSYTNKWKNDIPQEKKVMKNTQHVDPNTVFNIVPIKAWKNPRNRNSINNRVNIVEEKYYAPSLPLPANKSNSEQNKSIKFSRGLDEVQLVSQYLFEDERDANEVGNECFEIVLKKAKA
jgi:hypothetical protein